MAETYKKVKDSSLSEVAQTILKQTGLTDPLTFPDGFIKAIESIKTETPVTPLSVTPGDAAQVFDPPKGYNFGRVTVEAIPNNYGKISYNGAVLTVS